MIAQLTISMPTTAPDPAGEVTSGGWKTLFLLACPISGTKIGNLQLVITARKIKKTGNLPYWIRRGKKSVPL